MTVALTTPGVARKSGDGVGDEPLRGGLGVAVRRRIDLEHDRAFGFESDGTAAVVMAFRTSSPASVSSIVAPATCIDDHDRREACRRVRLR